jgi:hypothetical protein
MPEDREVPSESVSPDERRRHRRFPLKLRVLFERLGVAHLIQAETEDIGLGGVFIKTNRRPLEPGTRVSILIQHDGRELMLSGTVRWISDETLAQTHQGERGMGVQFDDLGQDKLLALRALIDARAALDP